MKEERVKASNILRGPKHKEFTGNKEAFIEMIRKALYLSKICSYAQGFAQLQSASEEYNWNLKPGEISMIFRGDASFGQASWKKSNMHMTVALN